MSDPIPSAVADQPPLDNQAPASPSPSEGYSDTVRQQHLIPPCPYRRLPDSASRVSAIVDPLLICGDARRALRLLPAEFIQTVVTSPPYWSLRDYQVADQIGCDDSLGSYISSLVDAFDELGAITLIGWSEVLRLGGAAPVRSNVRVADRAPHSSVRDLDVASVAGNTDRLDTACMFIHSHLSRSGVALRGGSKDPMCWVKLKVD